MSLHHRAPRTSVPLPRAGGPRYRVCLVCMGNICRSPMAESVLRAEIGRAGIETLVDVDSAGIGDWHAGEEMDARARAELARRGYPGTSHRARQIAPSWLDDRDLILAMDKRNAHALRRMAAGRRDILARVRLLRSFDPAAPDGAEVPDPYMGDAEAFTHAFDLIEAAAKELAARLAEMLARRQP